MATVRRSARVAAASAAASGPAVSASAKSAPKKAVKKAVKIEKIVKVEQTTVTAKSKKASTAKAAASKTRSSARVAAGKAKNAKNSQKTAATKRGKASSPALPSKKRKTGMKSAIVPTIALGVVDPEAGLDGEIEVYYSASEQTPYDAMLALVDPVKHTDKFYVLQLVRLSESTEGAFAVYSRWGRTGTSGQGLVKFFDELGEAVHEFNCSFFAKTGNSWTHRSCESEKGCYTFIEQDFGEKQSGYTTAKWQYYVGDNVDGKQNGWFDYDSSGSCTVEQLFHEYCSNTNFNRRMVSSGCWMYDVDLVGMMQTNATHPSHTQRRIRRVHPSTPNGDDSPLQASYQPPVRGRSIKPASSLIPAPAKPLHTVVKPPPAFIATSPVLKDEDDEEVDEGEEEGREDADDESPPVDDDFFSLGVSHTGDFHVVKSTEHDLWFDVVLNQCNITGGSNNNKYYRIQMAQDRNDGSFYVWTKWGRVGEPARRTTTAVFGPFNDEEGAQREFCKKFKAKTGNVFGADDFVAVTGKYEPVEIDYKAAVNVDVGAAGSGAMVKQEPDVEYMPSKLDAKTKELVKVMFSKDMRDGALSNFNLDLRRLPLGVPSESQIQQGVDVLNEIEDKLADVHVDETFDELSSKFYTTIPHSFGRRRPPVISSQVDLQSRYDMCNILMDIYSTNETMRKLEAKRPKKAMKQMPDPADEHYDTLKAKIEPVKRGCKEFKIIEKYFEETKAKYHGSEALLDVWSVDRNGAASRFQAYDSLDNRQLLWHGTNMAVCAPILTSGLRIMPHSGGRVGSGIYLATMQEKSAGYTWSPEKFACMFLVEAALGKKYPVVQDGNHASSLKKAPPGYQSVHATGAITPNKWTELKIDGKKVAVPAGPGSRSGVKSSFDHDELLVYNESQVRIRYIVTVKK